MRLEPDRRRHASRSGRSWPRARCAWSASRSRSSSADSQAAARDAADRIVVDYDPLPVVIDAENAVKPGAPQLHDDAPGNLCCTIAHKTEGFDDVVRRRARQGVADDRQPAAHAGRDRAARACVADWITSSGELTLYTSTQVPHFVRTFVVGDLRRPRVARCA